MDKNKLYELVSSLQKNIRRGNEEVAVERGLVLMREAPKMLFSRLKTILYEDLGGCINSNFSNLKLGLDDLINYYNSNWKDKELILTSLILGMCRTTKNRDACNLLIIRKRDVLKGNLTPIEDWALDRHTARGKYILKRGWKHFFKEAVKMKNDESNEKWKQEVQEAVIELYELEKNNKSNQKKEKKITDF